MMNGAGLGCCDMAPLYALGWNLLLAAIGCCVLFKTVNWIRGERHGR